MGVSEGSTLGRPLGYYGNERRTIVRSTIERGRRRWGVVLGDKWVIEISDRRWYGDCSDGDRTGRCRAALLTLVNQFVSERNTSSKGSIFRIIDKSGCEIVKGPWVLPVTDICDEVTVLNSGTFGSSIVLV